MIKNFSINEASKGGDFYKVIIFITNFNKSSYGIYPFVIFTYLKNILGAYHPQRLKINIEPI
jgi:hypothetical protein